jgi:hypothetical protein
MSRNFSQSRISLIFMGICLGLLARYILGAPAGDESPKMEIDRPLNPAGVAEDLETKVGVVVRVRSEELMSGFVPPIMLPSQANSMVLKEGRYQEKYFPMESGFSHGEAAMFEAHGTQLCASGCAASRHPTGELSDARYRQLISEVDRGPMAETNQALEELIFFGSQTRRQINVNGFGNLDAGWAGFLGKQLACSHARISIRVTDENGSVRTWVEPTLVPFDRRHVFKMKTNSLQSLITSGTVKRVGLNHAWVRL